MLVVASLAAAVHPPLLGHYAVAKAGVEALGNSLRHRDRVRRARASAVAYFAFLDTDMTSRGFGTQALSQWRRDRRGRPPKMTPLPVAIDAIEQGVLNRSRRVVAPRSVARVLHARMLAQRLLERRARRGLDDVLAIARVENAPLTTQLPQRPERP